MPVNTGCKEVDEAETGEENNDEAGILEVVGG
jgi:hypothetical protein